MGNVGVDALAAIKIFEYFADSNFAGKWSFRARAAKLHSNCLMWSKFQEIKQGTTE